MRPRTAMIGSAQQAQASDERHAEATEVRKQPTVPLAPDGQRRWAVPMKCQQAIGWVLIATLPMASVIAWIDWLDGSRQDEIPNPLVYLHAEPGLLEVMFDTWRGHVITLKLLLVSVAACILGIIFLIAREAPQRQVVGCPTRRRS